VYLTIRWSDLPAPDCQLLQVLFVHRTNVDAAALNTVTGYITGYVVYILTAFLPERKRKKPIKEIVMKKLAVLYSKSVYLLLLMCKNCCSTEAEWREIISNSDIDCFNDKFFEYIERFDISCNADTIFLHKENRTPLTWAEYIYEKSDDMYKQLDALFIEYHYYLENEDLQIINGLKNSKYLDVFTGKGYEMSILVHSAEDNYGYYDDFPATMFFTSSQRLTPIFATNEGVLNKQMLIEYVEILRQTHDYLVEYKKKSGLDIFHEDYAVEKLKEKNVGHLGQAIFRQIN